jgi:ATP synthase protein I
MKHSVTKNEALGVVTAQIVGTLSFFPIIYMLGGGKMAGSFMMGGLISFLPNFYLYRRVFTHFGARQAEKMLKALYRGEAMKLVFTACGFAGAFSISWTQPLGVFLGYIFSLGMFFLAPLMMALMHKNNKVTT